VRRWSSSSYAFWSALARGRLAVPVPRERLLGAPALDRRGHHRHRGGVVVARRLGERVEGVLDLRRAVPVDLAHREARGFELGRQTLGRLLLAHPPRLPVRVAVEDRQHAVELAVDDVIERLADLPLARLTVADDAVNPLVQPVQACGLGQPGRDRKPLAQRARGGVEEREPLAGVRVPLDLGIKGAQRGEVLDLHRPPVRRVGPDVPAQTRVRRVHRRNRMPLAQDEAVGGRVIGELGAPAHRVEHEHGDDVPDAHRRGGVPAACGGAHFQRELVDVDRLGVDCGFKGHAEFLSDGRPDAMARGRPRVRFERASLLLYRRSGPRPRLSPPPGPPEPSCRPKPPQARPSGARSGTLRQRTCAKKRRDARDEGDLRSRRPAGRGKSGDRRGSDPEPQAAALVRQAHRHLAGRQRPAHALGDRRRDRAALLHPQRRGPGRGRGPRPGGQAPPDRRRRRQRRHPHHPARQRRRPHPRRRRQVHGLRLPGWRVPRLPRRPHQGRPDRHEGPRPAPPHRAHALRHRARNLALRDQRRAHEERGQEARDGRHRRPPPRPRPSRDRGRFLGRRRHRLHHPEQSAGAGHQAHLRPRRRRAHRRHRQPGLFLARRRRRPPRRAGRLHARRGRLPPLRGRHPQGPGPQGHLRRRRALQRFPGARRC
jgi:hypothetical protein